MEKLNNRNITFLLLLSKALLYCWLCYNALPFFTSDVLVMQQPAVEKLFKGTFTAAAQFEKYSYFNLVFAYPPLYTIFIYFAFYLFGFSIYTALAFDLVVEYIISIIALLIVYRQTSNFKASILTFILSSILIFPIGRPEMLAIMFILISYFFLIYSRSIWIATLFLGLALTTTPISACPFYLFFIYSFINKEISVKQLIGSSIIVGVLPLFIWSYAVGFHIKEGFIQLREMGTLVPEHNLLEILQRNTLFGIGLLIFLAFLLITILERMIVNVKIKLFKITILTYIIMSILLLHIFKRPEYDYRLLIITCILLLGKFHSFSYNQMSSYILLGCVIIFFSYTYLLNFAKLALMPLGWTNEIQKYDYNQKYVQTFIPKSSSIGGAGNLFYMINDGRTYYGNRNLSNKFKPDYMIFKGIKTEDPYAFVITNDWKHILQSEYYEILNPDTLYYTIKKNNHSLINKIFNTDDDDFRLRIWKRKTKGSFQ